MKLTITDKAYLKKIHYSPNDIKQIEEASKHIDVTGKDNRPLTFQEAIDILGRETFLSGLARCTFHWTSVRYRFIGNVESEKVHFDSSRHYNS